ncbi:hypothetical protein PQ465_12280 [Sphingobacterium oryzagri]|uniref:Fibrobacter succinogenes major paralogous domain-containing protein n=1 Tax=Sphingobacterium oryzagri TaxID=3025669 RepID=A0ABY7WBR9_9SPHI|nr:hypothetical protein [Sphingobacterium sp. KACC 22765]WDF67083.1 hypothetical protein PQ465_12280 [Sphingobacterium sp. KACC 22765]
MNSKYTRMVFYIFFSLRFLTSTCKVFRFTFCILCSLCLLQHLGCKSSIDEITTTQDGAILNVNIAGIDSQIDRQMASMMLAQDMELNKNSLRKVPPPTNQTLHRLDSIDVFTSALVTNEARGTANSKKKICSVHNKLHGSLMQKATIPLNNGVSYRIIILDQNSKLVANVVATAGDNPQIRVDGHRRYTWYALSVNEISTQVPNINANGVVLKSSLVNKDVLYASGDISTVDGNNNLEIIFRRMTTRYRVKLDVRGLFARQTGNTNLSVITKHNNGSLITMGDLNIYNGTFADIQPHVNATVSNSQMTNVDNTPLGTTKYADFFTLDTDYIKGNNLSVKINRLDILRDDNSVRSYTSPIIVTFTERYTPIIGNTYELTLAMVEQPIRVHGILWARTNLTYDNSKTDSYRFKTTPSGSRHGDRNKDYWNWMSATTTGVSEDTDPCTLVYPTGTWRMPTGAEWQWLGRNFPDSRVHRAFLFWGTQFAYIWKPQQENPNSVYDVNDLFLAFGGYRNEGGTLSGVPLGIASIGSGECHYWSSTSVNNSQAIAFKSSYNTTGLILSWGRVTFSDESKKEGRNIRCVRQSSYN